MSRVRNRSRVTVYYALPDLLYSNCTVSVRDVFPAQAQDVKTVRFRPHHCRIVDLLSYYNMYVLEVYEGAVRVAYELCNICVIPGFVDMNTSAQGLGQDVQQERALRGLSGLLFRLLRTALVFLR